MAGKTKERPRRTDGRPNILWICTDQQRYDTIHCLNNPHIQTPNLDRLCESGVAFSRAYCQSPICTPSRASFLTGLYPSAVHANRNGNARFLGRFPLITRLLADAGYDCGLAGKLHLAAAWRDREQRIDDGYRVFHYSHGPTWKGTDGSMEEGRVPLRPGDAGAAFSSGNDYLMWLYERGIPFNTVFENPEGGVRGTQYRPDAPAHCHQAVWCADRAIDFMREERDAPWLMSVNIFDPHPPFDGLEGYVSRYRAEDLPPPIYSERDEQVQARLRGFHFQSYCGRPKPESLRIIASYYGMISLIDEQVGRMIAALEESGQRENTLVIFTSDHGEMLGDHGLLMKGCRFYEGAVRVPLILSWPGLKSPGRFERGVVSPALVELTDIAPTLAELAGLSLHRAHGRSLVPLLQGSVSAEAHREFVRCEYYDTLASPERGKGPDAYQRRPNHATMYRDERYKLVSYHGLDYGELYDLLEDPRETENLWERADRRDVRAELTQRSFDASMVIADPGTERVGKY